MYKKTYGQVLTVKFTSNFLSSWFLFANYRYVATDEYGKELFFLKPTSSGLYRAIFIEVGSKTSPNPFT